MIAIKKHMPVKVWQLSNNDIIPEWVVKAGIIYDSEKNKWNIAHEMYNRWYDENDYIIKLNNDNTCAFITADLFADTYEILEYDDIHKLISEPAFKCWASYNYKEIVSVINNDYIDEFDTIKTENYSAIWKRLKQLLSYNQIYRLCNLYQKLYLCKINYDDNNKLHIHSNEVIINIIKKLFNPIDDRVCNVLESLDVTKMYQTLIDFNLIYEIQINEDGNAIGCFVFLNSEIKI